MRQTAEFITSTFLNSGKKSLIITGSIGSGKTSLLKRIKKIICRENPQLPESFQGITTYLVPGKAVILKDNLTEEFAEIGRHIDKPKEGQKPMVPVDEGFETLGVESLKRAAASEHQWVSIDEIGFLESRVEPFKSQIRQVFDKKRVLAVLRKQDLDFLNELKKREDVYLIDIDGLYPKVGCVIMASGMSKRFGSNKLLKEFCGVPMVQKILDATDSHMINRRVVVTRTKEIESICKNNNISVIYHSLPNRNDTVKLGTFDMKRMEGCIFCPSDQPLLKKESIEKLITAFEEKGKGIYRLSAGDVKGTPALFSKEFFGELMELPEKMGGGYLIKKYPHLVYEVEVEPEELFDVDTQEDYERIINLKNYKL